MISPGLFRKGRGTRKPAAKRAKKKTERVEAAEGETDSLLAADTRHVPEQAAVSEAHAPVHEAEHPATEAPAAKKKPSRKPTTRSRRPRKTESANDAE